MKRQIKCYLNWIILSSLLGCLALPLLYLGYRSFGPEQAGAATRLGRSLLLSVAWNTIWIVLASGVLALMIGGLAAWAVSHHDFPGRSFLEAALCLPFVLPPYIVAMVYQRLAHDHHQLGIEVEDGRFACLFFAFTLYPYVYLPFRIALQNQSASYIEMGRSLGLSKTRLMWKIIVPLCAPTLFAGSLLVTMEVLSDYGTVTILGVKTLSALINEAWFSMYAPRLAARLSLLALLVPILAVGGFGWFTRRAGFQNPTNRPAVVKRTRLKGARAAVTSLALLLPVIVGFVVPTGALLFWCGKTLNKMKLGTLLTDLSHTLSLSLKTTAACLVFACALALLRRTQKGGKALRAAAWLISLNFAMPAMVLAIAFLFITRDLAGSRYASLLSDTTLLLFGACVIRHLCFAYFSMESGLRSLSERLDEAVLTLHKGRLFIFFRVHLPLLRRYLLMGGLMVFICVARELTLSLVLQPFDYNTLALRVYSFAGVMALPESAVFALCLVLLSIYPVFSMGRWFSQEQSHA